MLAMCIVVVFCIGLGKLWWTNRLMRKREGLVREKHARLTEMRKAGLPPKRGSTIPFGVRAIQHGIEVDGIWISRPATPNPESPNKRASMTTLVALDSDSSKKGKHLSVDSRAVSENTLEARPRRKQSPSDTLAAHRLAADSDSVERNPSPAPRASPRASPRVSPRSAQFAAPKPKRPRLSNALSEDTLWRLEGQGLGGRYAADTYIPTSSSGKYARGPSQRSSVVSSGGESVESQSRSGMSGRSSSGRSYTSARSSRPHHSSRNIYEPRVGYYPVSHISSEREHREPGEIPRNRTPISPIPQSETHSPPLQGHDLPLPGPTFGPGDQHMNRSARRVNQGFEVLPAGTFGSPHEYRHHHSGNDDLESGGDRSPGSKSPRSPKFGKNLYQTQQYQYPTTPHF